MTFINEYISEEDLKKYNFSELNKRPSSGGAGPSNFWTIDKINGVWLREFSSGINPYSPESYVKGLSIWDFYWKGYLMMVKIKLLENGGRRGEHCWSRKKLLDISLPKELNEKHDLVLKDLEVGLNAYKDGGVLSISTSYELKFEV